MQSAPLISVSQVMAVITMVVTELVNDAVIDGHWAKIITGLAGIIVPAVWMLADAWIHHSHAKVEAATVLADRGVINTNVAGNS